MAIALGGTDKDRLTKIFTDLAEGGTIKMPLAEQPPGVPLLAGARTNSALTGW